ncbi:MAG: SxtJ family membrane protein [Verrucomicrobiota bacterium]
MSWIKSAFEKLDHSPRALRRFGFTVGAVMLSLGGILLWRQRDAAWPFIVIGALLLAGGAIAPRTLKYLHTPWMIFSLVLGWVMSRILLTIVFFLVVTPLGLLQRVCRKRAIEFAFKTDAVSFWQVRSGRPTSADYERQF